MLQEMLWETLREILWKILQGILWEILQEILWEILWNRVGGGGKNLFKKGSDWWNFIISIG